ncbi:MAG TPA: tetratricopeptide repeat protein [Candidatus Polarisedimenticolia bacterium]|jgi:tetratricopeptide (TPR) repeat protein|nr:tetratricopeptide repeat protein [Candidatus Polarisedimenticolia bacterium]
MIPRRAARDSRFVPFARRRWIGAAAVLIPASFVLAEDSPGQWIEQGHFRRAEVLLRAPLQKTPADPQMNFLMSRVDLAFRRLDDAVAHAEKAVAADGANASYHGQLAEALGAQTDDPDRGMFDKLSLAKRVRKEAEAALALDPKNESANSVLLTFYLEAPGIAGGSKDKAKELADRVTQLDPAQGYQLQMEIARKEQRMTDLEPLARKAFEAGSNSFRANLNFAGFNLSRTPPDPVAGEKHARAAMKLDAQRIGPYSLLASLFVTQKRWNELDPLLADAERAIPDNLGAHYQAARAILLAGDAGQMGRAESYLRKYLGQPPEGGQPSLAGAHWRLGLVLEKQGRKDEARAEVQTAVTLDPKLKAAQQDLKRLK